jgi:hypothetical protein
VLGVFGGFCSFENQNDGIKLINFVYISVQYNLLITIFSSNLIRVHIKDIGQ